MRNLCKIYTLHYRQCCTVSANRHTRKYPGHFEHFTTQTLQVKRFSWVTIFPPPWQTQAVTGVKFKPFSHLKDATEGDYNFYRQI